MPDVTLWCVFYQHYWTGPPSTVASESPAGPFVEFDLEIISTVILLLLLIQKRVVVSVARYTDRLNMTIAVDWNVKPQTKQTDKSIILAQNDIQSEKNCPPQKVPKMTTII